jgi:hypothetical protein
MVSSTRNPRPDDVPRAVQPADSLFDGAFQVASGDAAGVLVQINVEDRKIGIPILGDFRRLSQRRLGVRRRREPDWNHNESHVSTIACGG